MEKNKVIIIAEAGVNHNGSLELAKELVDVAVEAGVDIIKFQTFKTENLIIKSARKAEYQVQGTGQEETQFDMLKKLELTKEDHLELIEYCNLKGIQFLSTPFDLDSIQLLCDLGIEIFKIPSGEITNYPFLKKIASLNTNIILSTGMSTLDEVRDAVTVLKQYGKGNIVILQCNTEYPTPMKDVNLLAMLTLKKEFSDCKVGYSDHTLGIEVPIAAVALGASVIEKHFTLNKNMDGPDHKASLEPGELSQMVKSIRNIEIALGTGIKVPSESELKNIDIARKSIVASSYISKGDIFSEENISIKRPGNGISPMKWEQIIGQTAARDFEEDELIELL